MGAEKNHCVSCNTSGTDSPRSPGTAQSQTQRGVGGGGWGGLQLAAGPPPCGGCKYPTSNVETKSCKEICGGGPHWRQMTEPRPCTLQVTLGPGQHIRIQHGGCRSSLGCTASLVSAPPSPVPHPPGLQDTRVPHYHHPDPTPRPPHQTWPSLQEETPGGSEHSPPACHHRASKPDTVPRVLQVKAVVRTEVD